LFEEVIAGIAKSLDKHNIPYMIIGGQAVLLYGEARVTRDIDITLGVNIDSYKTIKKICQNFPLKILVKNPEDFIKDTMVLPSLEEKTGIRVDFIFSLTSFEKEAIERANIIKISGQKVAFAAIEDLVVFKMIAGRERDLEDVRNLVRLNPDIKKKHVEKILKIYDQEMDTLCLKSWMDISLSK
jgi:predicted nucleotidyltransferase